jgi:hypothetical protein
VGSDSVRACASVGGSTERERILENKDQITKQVELETERRTLKQRPHIEHDAWLVAAVDEDGHRGREEANCVRLEFGVEFRCVHNFRYRSRVHPGQEEGGF